MPYNFHKTLDLFSFATLIINIMRISFLNERIVRRNFKSLIMKINLVYIGNI